MRIPAVAVPATAVLLAAVMIVIMLVLAAAARSSMAVVMLMPVIMTAATTVVVVIVMAVSMIAPAAAPVLLVVHEVGNDPDGELDLLESDLLPDHFDKPGDHAVGLLDAVQLQTNGFALQLGQLLHHFAVEREGEIGVDLLLQLVRPPFGPVPWPGFHHGEDDLARGGVKSEKIDEMGVA